MEFLPSTVVFSTWKGIRWRKFPLVLVYIMAPKTHPPNLGVCATSILSLRCNMGFIGDENIEAKRKKKYLSCYLDRKTHREKTILAFALLKSESGLFDIRSFPRKDLVQIFQTCLQSPNARHLRRRPSSSEPKI